MSRLAAFLVAVAVLLGSAALYDSIAGDTAQLDSAVVRLAEVPLMVGDWKGSDVPKDDKDARAFAQAGARGYWVRIYVHQRTHVSVYVTLMCGRSGKMAVHTPEVCYDGAGYELADQPALVTVADKPGQGGSRFWTGQFSKKTAPATSLRLYWAWNSKGDWQAAANPRWQFHGEPFLYKLYVSRDVSSLQPIDADRDPAADLLRQLVPVLERSLFPTEM